MTTSGARKGLDDVQIGLGGTRRRVVLRRVRRVAAAVAAGLALAVGLAIPLTIWRLGLRLGQRVQRPRAIIGVGGAALRVRRDHLALR